MFLETRSAGAFALGENTTAPAMARPYQNVPTAPEPQPVVSPLPSTNQVDAAGTRTAVQIARGILDRHMAGLQSRREHDLNCEKLLLHIDGAGDLQWADIFQGQRVEIPRYISEYRKTENVLRLVVDNAVAHHTTMPLRYFSDSQPDRRARDRAMIDTIWINHLADQQDLNSIFADALYMAMPAGFCPVHGYWREGSADGYEGTGAPPSAAGAGFIDCFTGNPFDTVFDRAAKRGSIYWASYGRLLPASLVRSAFNHVPGVAGLEGTTRVPSAALFQRIARSWRSSELGMHGTPVIGYRREAEGVDELMYLICSEILPGVDPDYPEGRLQLIAVPGTVDLLRGERGAGDALLLADQPLPGGDYSFSIFYSHHRGDDVLGKPWVEDIDQLQVDMNIGLSKKWEAINRMIEAPIVAPGGALSEDMATVGSYDILEVDPALANWRPRTMEWSPEILQALDKEVSDKKQAIFTGGGYQAVSRGEAPGSRMAYRAIVALQQADNTIHGPVNQRFRKSACEFAQKCWKQMKAYGDVPWLITVTGDEYAYLAEPYIDKAKLSPFPPNYKLVNAFGASPELRAQEVLELMGTRGADGQPFLRTDEARRQYPNSTIFDDAGDPKTVARRRAKTIATRFVTLADQFRQQSGMDMNLPLNHPAVQQAAMSLFGQMETQFPRLRDDDLAAHLTALSEITQDETVDPIARLAAMQRQNLYFEWQAMMAAPGVAPGGAAPGGSPQQRPDVDRRRVAGEMQSGYEESARPTVAATARG